MPREHPVGIDLGTTFSAAAWVDSSGHTAMIRNAEGDLLTPSIVLFTDEEVAVGKEARTATTVHPELVAEWVKRDMGLPYYTRPIHGRKLPPEVIQACILRKLKQDVVRTLGQLDRVVITVPAYFDEPRRHRTANAGEMAGLKVLDIVNEPTAAALAFGETLGYLPPGAAPKKEMTLFVYDLGGGTFDATLLRLAPGHIETIATDGDVQLGGHDWDMRMAEYVADEFKKRQGIDPRKDEAAMNRVLAAVIDAKHTLSARGRSVVRVELMNRSMDVPVTREQFCELTADLLERTAYTSRQLLAEAKMSWKDVSRLLLVGGATRMPMVGDMLRQLTGLEPDHTVNPDEAVARGAALYAAYLLGKEDGGRAQFKITNVNSHSLGVEGIAPETLRKTNVVLIPRNTPLPAKVTERFATKAENQRSIVVQILEGESPQPGDCTPIGRTAIHNLPEGLPKNWPIEVTFNYGANGRLSVQAVVSGTDQTATLNLERTAGMSDEGISRWKQAIDASAGFQAFESMVDEVMDEDKPDEPAPVKVPTKPAAKSRVSASKDEDFDSIVQDVLEEMPMPNDNGTLHSGSKASPNAPTSDPLPKEEATPGNASVPVDDMNGSAAPAGTPEDASKKEGEGAANEEKKPSPEDLLPIPRWLFSLIGHVCAALIGLALGYAVLHWWHPAKFPLPESLSWLG